MTPIPTDVPLTDEARRALAERGIVSMENLAGVAYAAPADFALLVGDDAMKRLLRYIEERYPSLVPTPDTIANRTFALGARSGDVADLPRSSEAIRTRDRLFAHAQHLRALGDVAGAQSIEREIDALATAGRTEGSPPDP